MLTMKEKPMTYIESNTWLGNPQPSSTFLSGP